MAKRKGKKASGRPLRKSLSERKKNDGKKMLLRKAEKIVWVGRWPVNQCLINASWREAQMATIVMSRTRPDGNYVGGMCFSTPWI